MLIWEVLKALLQGVVQGITEWLPISSTGHLILVEEFLPFSLSAAFFDLFKVVIQLGSIIAVVVAFFQKLNPFSKRKTLTERRDTWRLWLMVAIASVPTAIVGLLFKKFDIDDVMEFPLVIAIALIVYGVLFIVMESRPRTPRLHTPNDVTWKTALLMGSFQALALIPGTSRSGSTILGALILGCSRYAATEFSFFMAIPAMFGASGLEALFFMMEGNSLSWEEWLILGIGTLVSFAVSLFVIRFLMDFIKKHDFKVFGWYRIALGVILLILILVGALK